MYGVIQEAMGISKFRELLTKYAARAFKNTANADEFYEVQVYQEMTDLWKLLGILNNTQRGCTASFILETFRVRLIRAWRELRRPNPDWTTTMALFDKEGKKKVGMAELPYRSILRCVVAFDKSDHMPDRKKPTQHKRSMGSDSAPYNSDYLRIVPGGIEKKVGDTTVVEEIILSRVLATPALRRGLIAFVLQGLWAPEEVPNWASSGTDAVVYVDNGYTRDGIIRMNYQERAYEDGNGGILFARIQDKVAKLTDPLFERPIGEAELGLHQFYRYARQREVESVKAAVVVAEKEYDESIKHQADGRSADEILKTRRTLFDEVMQKRPPLWHFFCTTDTDSMLVAIMEHWYEPDTCFIKFKLDSPGKSRAKNAGHDYLDIAEAIRELKAKKWTRNMFFTASVLRGCDYYSRGHEKVTKSKITAKNKTASTSRIDPYFSKSSGVTPAKVADDEWIDPSLLPPSKGKAPAAAPPSKRVEEFDDQGCLMSIGEDIISDTVFQTRNGVFSEDPHYDPEDAFNSYQILIGKIWAAKHRSTRPDVAVVRKTFDDLHFIYQYWVLGGYRDYRTYQCTANPEPY